MMAVLVLVEQPADHAADHEPRLSSINGRRFVGLSFNKTRRASARRGTFSRRTVEAARS